MHIENAHFHAIQIVSRWNWTWGRRRSIARVYNSWNYIIYRIRVWGNARKPSQSLFEILKLQLFVLTMHDLCSIEYAWQNSKSRIKPQQQLTNYDLNIAWKISFECEFRFRTNAFFVLPCVKNGGGESLPPAYFVFARIWVSEWVCVHTVLWACFIRTVFCSGIVAFNQFVWVHTFIDYFGKEDIPLPTIFTFSKATIEICACHVPFNMCGMLMVFIWCLAMACDISSPRGSVNKWYNYKTDVYT